MNFLLCYFLLLNRLRFACVCVSANLYLQSDLLTVIFKDTFDVNCNVALFQVQWFGSANELLYVKICNENRDLNRVPLRPRPVRALLVWTIRKNCCYG